MSEFTPQDRERAQKTLTLIERFIEQSNERHAETRKLIEDQSEILKGHDGRIRNVEGFKAWVLGGAGLGAIGGLTSLTKWFGS